MRGLPNNESFQILQGPSYSLIDNPLQLKQQVFNRGQFMDWNGHITNLILQVLKNWINVLDSCPAGRSNHELLLDFLYKHLSFFSLSTPGVLVAKTVYFWCIRLQNLVPVKVPAVLVNLTLWLDESKGFPLACLQIACWHEAGS